MCACNAAQAQGEKTWEFKVGTIAPAQSTYIRIAREAMDGIERATKGKVRFTIYANGVKGDEPEMVRLIREGELASGFFTVSAIGEISPEFTALLMPLLFRNKEEVDYVRSRMQDTFVRIFRERGFELLAWADIGFGQLMSKVPVRSLADFRQRRVWLWPGEKLFPALADHLGVTSVPTPLAQVLDALRAGRIDTVYGNALGAVVLGWYRDIDYVMKWDLVYGPAVLVVGRKQWEGAPEGIRRLIVEQIQATLPVLTEAMRRDEETALKGMAKRGVKIITFDAEAEREFRALMPEFEKKFVEGQPRMKEVLEEVHRHLKQYRSALVTAPRTGRLA